MTVADLGGSWKTHGPLIRAAVREGTSAPQRGRRRALSKPGGGTRHLGLATGLARFIVQALRPGLQEEWAPTCSEGSDGVRPRRRAHPAVEPAQGAIRQGYTWGVDSDLERFCDRVNHDALMSRVRRRVKDRRVVSLLPRGRKAGVVTLEGSGAPRLATLRLDELGKELEKRGPGFARSADEANI